ALIELHVARGDPGTAGAEMADGLAVARQFSATVVDDPQGGAETGAARDLPAVELLLVAKMLRARTQAWHRASQCLGHAPGLDIVDVVLPLELLAHRARRGRARRQCRAQRRELAARASQPVEQD